MISSRSWGVDDPPIEQYRFKMAPICPAKRLEMALRRPKMAQDGSDTLYARIYDQKIAGEPHAYKKHETMIVSLRLGGALHDSKMYQDDPKTVTRSPPDGPRSPKDGENAV